MRRTLWSSCCSWIPCQRRLLLLSSSHELSYNWAPQTAWAEWKKLAVGQKWDPVWHLMPSSGENSSIKTVPSHKCSDFLLLLLCTSYLSSPSMSSVESFPSLKVFIDLLTPAQARVHLGKISTTKPDFLIKTEVTPVNTVLHSSRAQNHHLTLSLTQYMQVKWRQTMTKQKNAVVLSLSKREDSHPDISGSSGGCRKLQCLSHFWVFLNKKCTFAHPHLITKSQVFQHLYLNLQPRSSLQPVSPITDPCLIKITFPKCR